jgi:hypothetical protein
MVSGAGTLELRLRGFAFAACFLVAPGMLVATLILPDRLIAKSESLQRRARKMLLAAFVPQQSPKIRAATHVTRIVFG